MLEQRGQPAQKPGGKSVQVLRTKSSLILQVGKAVGMANPPDLLWVQLLQVCLHSNGEPQLRPSSKVSLDQGAS